MAYGLTKSALLAKSSSQYLTAADTASISVTGDMTIELWLKVTSLPGSGVGTPIVFKGDYNTNNSYQLMYLNDSGTPKIHGRIFASSGNSNFADSKFTYTLTTGTWIHVAMVIKPANSTATKFELFINGVSQGNGTATLTGTVAAIYDSNNTLGIGSSVAPVGVTDYYLDSGVSLVRIWDVARTGTQIADNMCSVLGSTTNLKAEWTLDNSLTDNSGNSNTLTNVNTVTFPTDTPSTCATSSGPANLKSLDSNVKSNIKSFNSNVIANIKSINANA